MMVWYQPEIGGNTSGFSEADNVGLGCPTKVMGFEVRAWA